MLEWIFYAIGFEPIDCPRSVGQRLGGGKRLGGNDDERIQWIEPVKRARDRVRIYV